MKSTGVVRKVDQLGRIVLPNELRNTLDIQEGTPMEIFTEGEQIILRAYRNSCVFCGEANDVINYKGKKVCKHCLEEIKKSR